MTQTSSPALTRLRALVRSVAAVAVTGLVATAAVAAAPTASAEQYAQIEGNGSTWSEVILQQWISDVDASGMKVIYSGGGSSRGRKDFANNLTDFGISEIPYQGRDEYGQVDSAGDREFAYMPIVAGGTAFTYNLKVAGNQVKNLRLSGATIAKIFTNQITNWNDKAIKADNNGRVLPSLPITPVVRSDGSGTTAQFTTWLDKEHPSQWRSFYGKAGLTSYYPRKGRSIAASSSDQVMNTIASASGNGTIGYVEYSYPLNKRYPVVKVLNKSGYYVEPTQYNVAVAMTRAQIETNKSSPLYLTQKLEYVYSHPDPRAYPLSSYSYLLLPTGKNDRRMTTAKRQTLADFMYYSLCQGQRNAGPYGYSPLPVNLVQAGFDQIRKLNQADAGVNLSNRDVTSCNNPTFDGKNLSSNKLAKIAPMPAACDKTGAGPCNMVTGTGESSTNKAEEKASANPNAGSTVGIKTATKGAAGGTGSGTTTGAGTTGGAAAAGGSDDVVAAGPKGSVDEAASTIDPETGAAVVAAAAAPGQVTGVPVELLASRGNDSRLFGGLAALELLALVLVPGLAGIWYRRRQLAGGVR
ncbi:phosphate ABC transporter substrate-binding protein PstS [Janibacter sp. G1551]|uniref:phosphate ABC transporter substrate-binding protein PstS n=1 Tax=Janibacter sp. G1551 TaxID=3420440 RepID=UPI003D0341CA